jgi:hypothetical protein
VSTFKFTKFYNVSKSTLVEGVYLNENNNQAAVDLDDSIYVYDNVTATDVDRLIGATSVGSYYANTFKREFGPSEYIGIWSDIDFKEEPLRLKIATNEARAIGGIILDGNTVVTSSVTPVRKHEIIFTVDESAVEKEYFVQATSVDQAINVLKGIGSSLGLEFNVKRVVVYFE